MWTTLLLWPRIHLCGFLRTSHGSTLSFTVMAKIAQMCGRADFEWEWFMEAAKSDIYDRQGTTHEGIHCAVMAGTIDIIIRFAVCSPHTTAYFRGPFFIFVTRRRGAASEQSSQIWLWSVPVPEYGAGYWSPVHTPPPHKGTAPASISKS